VILWATSMVDTDSSNFEELKAGGYYVKNALNGTSLLKWWHGEGLLLDYSNPDAKAWWEKQLDNILQLGVDGWKVDGTDPFIMEYLVPHGYSGVLTYRDYADAYYGHFFDYTRQQNGEHCLIMSRPVDSYNVLGSDVQAYLNFSPRAACKTRCATCCTAAGTITLDSGAILEAIGLVPVQMAALQSCSCAGLKWELFCHSWRMAVTSSTDPGPLTSLAARKS